VSDGSRSGRWTRSPTTNTAACCAAGCSTSATPWTPTRPKHCPPLPNSGGRPRNSYWRRSRADAMRQCPPSDPTRDIPAMRRVRRRLGVVNPRLRRLPPHRTVRGTPWRLRVPCRSPVPVPLSFPPPDRDPFPAGGAADPRRRPGGAHRIGCRLRRYTPRVRPHVMPTGLDRPVRRASCPVALIGAA
jgi:hypothetical protein